MDGTPGASQHPPPPPPPATQFHLFPRLPAELQRRIWKSVPQPARIITQLPCIDCVNARVYPRANVRVASWSQWQSAEHHATMKHPTWYVRYVVVHPKGSEVFGPLQACYESRKIWRKKYHDPRGHKVAAKLRRAGIPTPALDKFHFTMPYICYETDIFTVSKAWNIGHTSDRDQEETFLDWWDPFLGLDRARIQHAGLRLWDNIEPFSDTVTSLDIKRLDALRTLSLFMLGPDPGLEPGITSARPGWVQMSPLVLQRDFYFELRDISPSQLEHHPMFRDRIISRRSTTGRLDRPLRVLVPWTKAWLWHYVHCGKAMHKDVFLQDLGPDYMMDPLGWAGRPCPLGLSGCQTGDYAHSQKNIWDWIPEKWKIKTKFLCEKEWLQDLERVGLFDDNKTAAGDFAAFYRLKQEVNDRAALRWVYKIFDRIANRRKATGGANILWFLSLGG